MFYGIKNEYLENNKEELINRKIKNLMKEIGLNGVEILSILIMKEFM